MKVTFEFGEFVKKGVCSGDDMLHCRIYVARLMSMLHVKSIANENGRIGKS